MSATKTIARSISARLDDLIEVLEASCHAAGVIDEPAPLWRLLESLDTAHDAITRALKAVASDSRPERSPPRQSIPVAGN